MNVSFGYPKWDAVLTCTENGLNSLFLFSLCVRKLDWQNQSWLLP